MNISTHKIFESCVEITAIFLCNYRFDHKLKGFIEDFHLAYLYGKDENIHFKYKNPLDCEYGFEVRADGKVNLFLNKTGNQNLKCHLSHYLMTGKGSCNIREAITKAYQILEQYSDIEMALILSNNPITVYDIGFVLQSPDYTLPLQMAIQNALVHNDCWIKGKAYLAIVRKDKTVVLEDISSG